MTENQTAKIEEPNTEAPAYISNPFKLIKPSYQSLIELNSGTSLKFTLLSIFSMILAISSLAVMFSYFLTLLYSAQANEQIPSGFVNNDNTEIFGMLLITFLIFITSSTMTQIQTAKIALAAADKKVVNFKEIFTTSFKNIPAVAGLYAMLMAILFVIVQIVTASFASDIQLGNYLSLTSIIAVTYLMLRESFAIHFIIQRGLGPIKALKASWQLSAKNFVETAGAAAVGGLLVALVLAFDIVVRVFNQGSDWVEVGVNVLTMIIFIPLSLLTGTITATRFLQFINAQEGKSKKPALDNFNVLAVIILILTWMWFNILLMQAGNDYLQ